MSGPSRSAPPSAGSSTGLARTAVKNANYAAGAGELIPVDASGGSVTVTLPNAPADKTQVAVKVVALGTGNTVTVACAGADVLNITGGPTSAVLKVAGYALDVQYDAGSQVWTVFASDTPLSQLDLRYQPIIPGNPGQVATMQPDGTWAGAALPAGLNKDANGPLTGSPAVDFDNGARILVSDGTYNAFADVAGACGPNGQFTVIVYRAASAHVAKGVVKAIVCDADGTNPSAPITIASHATYDTRDCSINVMSDGRLALTYFWENGGDGSHVMHGCVLRFITVGSDGSLTVGPEINPTSDPFDAFVSCSGRVIDVGGGVLLWPVYGRMATQVAGQYSNVGVYKTTDAGATWPTYIEVANGGTTNKFQELNIVKCGDNTILGTIRNNTDSTVWTTKSTDLTGTTWSAPVSALQLRSQARLYKRRATNRIYVIGRQSIGGSSGRMGISWTDDHGATWNLDTSSGTAVPWVPDKRPGDNDPYVYGGISEHADGRLTCVYGWETATTVCQVVQRFFYDEGWGLIGDPSNPMGVRTGRLADERVKRVTIGTLINSGATLDVVVTWQTPWPDTNYTVTALIEELTVQTGTNGLLVRKIVAKDANSVTIRVASSGVNVPANSTVLHAVAHKGGS